MGLKNLPETGRKRVMNIGKSLAGKTAVLMLGACLTAAPSYASDKREIYNKVALGNCLLQGLISGMGGMQNGKSYWESFGKGCLGGLAIAGGKIAAGNDLNNAWPAKMAVAVGSSIADNAANGKPIDDSFGFDFGPTFFEWKKSDGEYKFRAYALPDSLGYAVNLTSKGAKLDAGKSLKYGTPIFFSKNLPHSYADAVTGANNIAILENHKNSEDIVLRHELIHPMQYSSSRSLGNISLNAFNATKKLKTGFEDYRIKLDSGVGHHLLHSADLFYFDNSKTPQEREAYDLAR